MVSDQFLTGIVHFLEAFFIPRLYNLLESLEYSEVKEKINAVDIDDVVVFKLDQYSYNLFWQTNGQSEQKVYVTISNYLSTINEDDIKTLCKQFGKILVKSMLKDKYQKMYAMGFISTSDGLFPDEYMIKFVLDNVGQVMLSLDEVARFSYEA